MANQTWWDFVQFSSREQLLSSDLNRMGKLASNVVQSRDLGMGGIDPSRNAITGLFDSAGIGAAINGAVQPGTITGLAATFNVTVGAFTVDAPVPASEPEGVDYQVIKWQGGVLTWPVAAAPDAINPRIVTIYATPEMTDANVGSRNVLVDPIARTVATQNIPKTKVPVVSALGVAIGVAANPPLPPALPFGAVGVWDVLIPAAVVNSLAFKFIRRTWPRIEYPISSFHGVLQGCRPTWSVGDESSTHIPRIDGTPISRVVIDGELIYHKGDQPIARADTANTPTAVGKTYDVPFYLYLCGGRNFPGGMASSFVGGVTSPCPFILMASKTVPDVYGRASADLVDAVYGTVPRGSCVYVGIGFSIAGTTLYKSCFIDGDWVFAETHDSSLVYNAYLATPNFNEAIKHVSGSGALVGPTDWVLNTRPTPSTEARINAVVSDTAGGGSIVLSLYPNIGTFNVDYKILAVESNGAGSIGYIQDRKVNLRLGFTQLENTNNLSTFVLNALAYNMNVPRLAV